MITAIIDYNSGNIRSIETSCRVAGRDVNENIMVTQHAEDLAKADRIILPGVGAFGDCRAGLRSLPGMEEALIDAIQHQGKPYLGVCVGMQMMADRGLEHGVHQGLGWIHGEVKPIEVPDDTFKIPHMGWNDLQILIPNHPMLKDIPNGAHAYFVHSYCFYTADPKHILATVEYGQKITAMVSKDNMFGTQFHPEKSQQIGLTLLKNFFTWKP